MKRFEFAIEVPNEFDISDESIDNIKSYLSYCFKVDDVSMGIYDIPDWLYMMRAPSDSIDPEIPF